MAKRAIEDVIRAALKGVAEKRIRAGCSLDGRRKSGKFSIAMRDEKIEGLQERRYTTQPPTIVIII